jgi:fatty acid desaturase
MTQPESNKRPSGEAESQKEPSKQAGALHQWMMIACVVLMGGAVLLVMWRGQSMGSGAWLLLPLALCLGMHFLMHRHLGHHDRDE